MADAKTQFEQLINEGKAASETFIKSSAEQLEQWTIDVSNGKMSQDEFDNLVSSQAILAKNFVASQALAAQKRAEELNGIIKTTKTLDELINKRFYWAPILEKVAHCVTPNIQITALDGAAEDDKGVTITLDGIAGGREPRGVAEDFRQMLLEQIGKTEPSVKVEFKTLEDLDTTVSVGGNNVTTAHFGVVIALDPFPKPPEPTGSERKSRPKKEES